MVDNDNPENYDEVDPEYRGPWGYLIRGMWRTPLGVLGLAMTVVSATLMVVGLAIDLLGLIENPYAAIATYMILPGIMVTGLILIPVAAFLRRRQWYKFGISRDHLKVNLSDHKHRKFLIGFLVITVINVALLAIIGYEGYHFTDSPYFCGVVCHQVMEPEFARYQLSPHARVRCVECHIGPGAQWFVRAKISGLRQVVAVLTDSYSRPIPAPVEHLRPARDTCEQCHWPEKFHGKKVKTFTHFTNQDQVTPKVNEIALHIGGRNPVSNKFEGIHWHVSDNNQVTYLPVDEKRMTIARVRVKRQDGTEDEFINKEVPDSKVETTTWRNLDCIDCHNRPTHVYDLPEDVVDFGLLSKKIDPSLPGIREDSLIAIAKPYESRDEAKTAIIDNLRKLQSLRGASEEKKNDASIVTAGEYLVSGYLKNIWPAMNIKWNTYRSHLGHPDPDGDLDKIEFGCWRCHNDNMVNQSGSSISQDCELCHDVK